MRTHKEQKIQGHKRLGELQNFHPSKAAIAAFHHVPYRTEEKSAVKCDKE